MTAEGPTNEARSKYWKSIDLHIETGDARPLTPIPSDTPACSRKKKIRHAHGRHTHHSVLVDSDVF